MIAWSWCFYLMGNHVSCVQLRQQEPPGGGGRSIKLIRWDGVVKMYERPIQVSELMLEFPKHRVCRSDSLYIGQKIPPLSQEDQLQPGHNYFLLPIHFFQSALSFLTITSLASSSSSTSISNNTSTSSISNNQKKNAFLNKAKSSTTSNCQPFHMQKTPSGSVRIRVTEEFLWKLMMGQGKIKQQEEEDELDLDLDQDQDHGRLCCSRSSTSTSRVCTTAQLQKEYSQLVGYSRQSCWKPKLETITESTEKKKKKKKKKLVASFGVKRSIRKISHHSVL